MNVSAISATPIKPQSFGKVEDDPIYTRVLETTDELNDKYVNSSSLKKPLAAALSIALAGAVAFVSGKRIASVVEHVFKKAPAVVEAGLKKGAKAVSGAATSLKGISPDKTILSENSKLAGKKLGKLINKIKIGKAGNFAGNVLDKVQEFGKKVYNRIATQGLKEGGNKAANAFENLFGIGAVSTILPGLLKRDTNGDGVSDILQRSQNVYTGTQTRFAGAVDKASTFADIIETLC